MMKNYLLGLICFSAATGFACSTTGNANVNANTANTAVVLDANNLPPGLSSSPVPVNGNIPGIPNPNDPNANKISTSNIPGIPDPNKKTPQPKNTPKIEGIPDQETLKKQMNTTLNDVNIVNNPPPGQTGTRPPSKRGNVNQ